MARPRIPVWQILPIVACIFLSQASGAEKAGDKWPLWVDGPRLHGMDLHSCRVIDEDGACIQAITRQDLQDLRDLGANLVNVSYPGVFTERPPYEVDPNALSDLDNLIAWAEEVALYVVIHFRTGPGRNEAAITWGDDPLYAVWQSQAAHDAWVEMWRFTADRYRNKPVVVGYNLIVEPHPNTLIDPDWEMESVEVQALAKGTLKDWNAFAAEITSAIRKIDINTPIIVDSIGWASAEWFSVLEPTGDARTIYSVHAYDPDVYIDQEPGVDGISYPDVVDDYGEKSLFDRQWLEENYEPVRSFAQEHNVPIYVGEFGVARWVPGASDFLQDQTGLFEQFGWNYAAYVWRRDEPYFNGFNLEYRPNPANDSPVQNNPLLNVFTERFAQNLDFPGGTQAGEEGFPSGETDIPLPPSGQLYHAAFPGGIGDQETVLGTIEIKEQ